MPRPPSPPQIPHPPKKANKHLSLIALLMLSLYSSMAMAELPPRVVVSASPLHSLVASLMEGVTSPVLLDDSTDAQPAQLGPFGKSQLMTADMVIWSDTGLAKAMTQAMEGIPLKGQLLTLSEHVPLLTEEGVTNAPVSHHQSRVPEFWHDPRLAIIAVRMITPRLVKLDPEHQERYLDNEIVLVKRLKNLEQEISTQLKPGSGQIYAAISGLNPYFSHRFLPSAAHPEQEGFQKASLNEPAACAYGRDTTRYNIGPALYFETMRHITRQVSTCLHTPDQKQLAS